MSQTAPASTPPPINELKRISPANESLTNRIWRELQRPRSMIFLALTGVVTRFFAYPEARSQRLSGVAEIIDKFYHLLGGPEIVYEQPREQILYTISNAILLALGVIFGATKWKEWKEYLQQRDQQEWERPMSETRFILDDTAIHNELSGLLGTLGFTQKDVEQLQPENQTIRTRLRCTVVSGKTQYVLRRKDDTDQHGKDIHTVVLPADMGTDLAKLFESHPEVASVYRNRHSKKVGEGTMVHVDHFWINESTNEIWSVEVVKPADDPTDPWEYIPDELKPYVLRTECKLDGLGISRSDKQELLARMRGQNTRGDLS